MNKIVIQDEEITTQLPAAYEPHASLAVSLARAEIDLQIATSRALPRSVQRAISNITTLATLDEETAAECIYAVPRGGKTIRGPSIRFAEVMASQWGNCRVGARVVHVDKTEGYVEAEGVFHDLETNVAQTARVRRTIQAKRGKGIDNDMIQLAGAAACSIARRNAILAGIPKGVARKGYLAVEDVIRGDIKTLVERRDLALSAFAKLGVTADRVFAALGITGADDITLDHLTTLTGARSALKNGESTIEELFPAAVKKGEPAKSLGDRLDALAAGPREAPAHDPETGEISGDQETDAEDASSDAPANGPAAAPQGAEDAQPRQSAQKAAAAPADNSPSVTTEAAAADPDHDAEEDTRTEEEKLLDEGREHAMEGKRTLDRWYNGLSADNLDRINPHMPALWKTAKAVDDAAKKAAAAADKPEAATGGSAKSRLLVDAEGAAKKGRRAFDQFWTALESFEQSELEAHMPTLMAAANKADGRA